MAFSGKVSAASVGAAASTLVADIVARHIGHPVPSDIMALVGAGITAGVTFVCGYLARHVPAAVVTEVTDFAATALAQVADEPVAKPAEVPAPTHNLMTGA